MTTAETRPTGPPEARSTLGVILAIAIPAALVAVALGASIWAIPFPEATGVHLAHAAIALWLGILSRRRLGGLSLWHLWVTVALIGCVALAWQTYASDLQARGEALVARARTIVTTLGETGNYELAKALDPSSTEPIDPLVGHRARVFLGDRIAFEELIDRFRRREPGLVGDAGVLYRLGAVDADGPSSASWPQYGPVRRTATGSIVTSPIDRAGTNELRELEEAVADFETRLGRWHEAVVGEVDRFLAGPRPRRDPTAEEGFITQAFLVPSDDPLRFPWGAVRVFPTDDGGAALDAWLERLPRRPSEERALVLIEAGHHDEALAVLQAVATRARAGGTASDRESEAWARLLAAIVRAQADGLARVDLAELAAVREIEPDQSAGALADALTILSPGPGDGESGRTSLASSGSQTSRRARFEARELAPDHPRVLLLREINVRLLWRLDEASSGGLALHGSDLAAGRPALFERINDEESEIRDGTRPATNVPLWGRHRARAEPTSRAR